MTDIEYSVDGLVDRIRQLPSLSPRVLIDGRSGAGKTTLALALGAHLGAEIIHLDSIYPGWSGLRAASTHVTEYVLTGDSPRWRRWDWVVDAPAEWHAVDQGQPWIIEGCGSLSVANRALADFAIWIDADDADRKHRALSRDGELFATHWDEWAAEEEAFIAAEHPRELADVVVVSSTVRWPEG